MLSPLQLKKPKNQLGARGEQLASRFLQAQGYRVLQTNMACGRSEVDLVCIDTRRSELVFVEVKTRSHAIFGHPSQAVNQLKLRSLRRVASVFLANSRLDLDWRFDIISVLPSKIEHFENVTWFG